MNKSFRTLQYTIVRRKKKKNLFIVFILTPEAIFYFLPIRFLIGPMQIIFGPTHTHTRNLSNLVDS